MGRRRGWLVLGAVAIGWGLHGEPAPAQPGRDAEAVRYRIPPKAPMGEVQVSSLGLTEVPAPGGGRTQELLRVRIVVWNRNDSEAWTFDPQEQRLDLPGAGHHAPIYATSDLPGGPSLEVGFAENRSIVLYFEVPDESRADVARGAFSVEWAVHTPEGVVRDITPFGA
jgi:hypothetical protein